MEYPQYNCRTPHINLVWIDNGKAEVVYQDIVKNGHITHSTGTIEGDHGPSENIETIWQALLGRLND